MTLEYLQYILIKAIFKLLANIPQKVQYIIAEKLGRLAFKIDKRHRHIAIDNIRQAFASDIDGDIDEDNIHKLAEKNFIHLAKFALEIPMLYKVNEYNLHNYIEFSGEEHIRKAIADKKPIIFISAHLGNFELMSLAVSIKFKISVNLVARSFDFKPLNRIINEIRTKHGNIVLNKEQGPKPIQKVLNEKKMLAILLDQNDYYHTGVYVPFFGRTACTNKSAAIFAIRYNAKVIPVFNIRLPDGRYRIIIEKPFVHPPKSKNMELDIINNTASYNSVIEKYIRMSPDNWFWVHNRWHLKPIPDHIKKKYKHLNGLEL